MRSESEQTLSVSLITPTYNENENIGLLADEIFQVLDGIDDIDLELIVVDDNSPDGTGEAAEKLKERYPVQVVHRAGKLGLGSAVMEGFALSERPYLGVMDADLSHDPIVLPQLIHALRDYDLTIGSRFGETSLVEEWAWHLSWCRWSEWPWRECSPEPRIHLLVFSSCASDRWRGCP